MVLPVASGVLCITILEEKDLLQAKALDKQRFYMKPFSYSKPFFPGAI